MTEFIKRLFLCAFLCLVAVGCTSRGYMQIPGQEGNSPTNPEQVAIYVTDDAGADYASIGAVVVNSDAGNDATSTLRKLKTQAAKMGADAIVNMKLRYSYGFWGISLEASGTAVKLK